MGRKKRLTEEQKIISTPIYLGLLILLFYPPYFRGLFFERELFPTYIYSGILFLLLILYKYTNLKETEFFRVSVDYAALAVVGAYLASLFVAVNLRSAVGELLKYVNYFIVYYLVSDMARGERDKKIILWTMILSATGVAFIGIGSAAGTINYPGSFVGGRINSTLQYPNTLAAYLTAAIMLGWGLQVLSEKRWHRAILAAVNYTLFLTFVFALSRAAWLMFPVFYLILIFGIPRLHKKKVIMYSLQTFVAGFLASPGFDKGISGGESSKVWLWYIVGLIFALAIFYILEKLSESININLKPVTLVCAFAVMIIVGAVAAYIALTTEKPLTLAHGSNEPESWKALWYTVDNIKPDTEYILKITVSTSPGQEQGVWGGAILIKSVDANNKETDIKIEFFNDTLEQQSIEIPFKTLKNTEKINIGLANNFPGTSATFSDAELFEAADQTSARRIILAYKYIPDAVARRLLSINLGEFSLQGRLSFYRDALKIIKEHPILGIGGDGWESAYFAYRSYGYFSTEVHSFFLQLMVETGIVGLISFMAIPVLIIKNLVLNKADDPARATFSWSVISSATAILGHSAVDFNLSLSAVTIYLWALFGLATTDFISVYSTDKRRKLDYKSYDNWVAIGLTIIFIIGSGILYTGYSYGQKAVQAIQKGNIMEAKEAFEKASKYDPLKASFKADLSQIYDILAEQGKNDEYKDKAIKLREKAVAMEPYNANFKILLADIYLREGRLEEGLSLIEEAAQLNPYNIEAWETLAEVYEKISEVHITKNQTEMAKKLLEKCVGIPRQIIELNRKSPKNDPGVEKLTASKNLMLYVAKAEKLLESPDKKTINKMRALVFAADFSLDLNEDEKPDLWDAWGESEIKVSLGEYANVKTAVTADSTLYLTENIDLEPDEFYEVEFDADVLEGGYKLNIIADNNEIFNLTTNIGEFVTPKDIEGKETKITVFIDTKSNINMKKLLLYKS